MLTRRLMLTSLVATCVFARQAAAASPEVFAVDGIAIRGADPVAYFTQGRYVAGDAAFAVQWKGAEWRFSSADHMAAFEGNPEKYAPQYGGYCAYAASKGAIATTVPDAWTIYEGKLYLNYSDYVRGVWSQDMAGNIALADGFWPAILNS